jgi:hypothetical protein
MSFAIPFWAITHRPCCGEHEQMQQVLVREWYGEHGDDVIGVQHTKGASKEDERNDFRYSMHENGRRKDDRKETISSSLTSFLPFLYPSHMFISFPPFYHIPFPLLSFVHPIIISLPIFPFLYPLCIFVNFLPKYAITEQQQ